MAANYFTELESAYSSLNIEDDIHEDFFSEFDLDEILQPELFSCSVCTKHWKQRMVWEHHDEEEKRPEEFNQTSWCWMLTYTD